MIEQVEFPRRVIFMRLIAELANNFRLIGQQCAPAHARGTSVGNSYEDVQRNDSAGVIPRIIIPVDCEHNANDPNVQVTTATGHKCYVVAVQLTLYKQGY